MVKANETIKIRFNMFPIPKYLRIRNEVKEILNINPLLVLPNSSDEVKRRLRKTRIKNRGSAPKTKGSRK